MRVPLVLAGDGIRSAFARSRFRCVASTTPWLAWAGLEGPATLLADAAGAGDGEAMQPYLQYGWQPQVMVVERVAQDDPRRRAGGL